MNQPSERLMDYLNQAVTFHEAVLALGHEAVVVGSVGASGGLRVPELLGTTDVAHVVDLGTGAVVYPEFVHRVVAKLEQVDDDPRVVDAVAIGGDEVGELQEVVGNDYGMRYRVDTRVREAFV